MPEDIHVTLWQKVCALIEAGEIATTPEVYEEMIRIPGKVGQCIAENKKKIVLEIGDSSWDWVAFISLSKEMKAEYEGCISEYNGNKKRTVGVNDISVICLAKVLGIPLVSQETRIAREAPRWRRIPDICDAQNVRHCHFSEFLRSENIRA